MTTTVEPSVEALTLDCCAACGSSETTVARTVLAPKPSDVLKCRQCGLLWRRDLVENLFGCGKVIPGAYYDRVASARRRLWENIVPKLEPHRRTNRLLDIGCAQGDFLVVARQHGWEAQGIEPSPAQSAYARDVLKVNVTTGLFGPGIFPREPFDVITLWNVLDYIARLPEAMQEIARLLVPGGVLVARVPNGRLHMAAYRASRLWGVRDVSVFPNFSFTHKALESLLDRAGFSRCQVFNSIPSTGDPYGLFGRLSARLTDGLKWGVYGLSQLLYYASGRSCLVAPSVVVFGTKQ